MQQSRSIRSTASRPASTTSADDDQGALLHAAVALYASCLRGGNGNGNGNGNTTGAAVQPQALYRALCADGARTLLLLRDAHEVVHEWESNGRGQAVSSPELSPSAPHGSTEINNNPPESKGEATPVAAKPWQRIVPLERTAEGVGAPRQGSEEDEVTPESEEEGVRADNEERDDRVWIAWSARFADSEFSF
ncbi:hypothetical protein V5799_003545 [Amblyomma americanum]|uniref:Uncharacterized protein n=1 Tax=Amblyomma americanum TaxID=6943 RepID=A0AAQ4D8N3_AMBAM